MTSVLWALVEFPIADCALDTGSETRELPLPAESAGCVEVMLQIMVSSDILGSLFSHNITPGNGSPVSCCLAVIWRYHSYPSRGALMVSERSIPVNLVSSGWRNPRSLKRCGTFVELLCLLWYILVMSDSL